MSGVKEVWVAWDADGTPLLASFSELNPRYARSTHTVTRETLLTPAHSAVLEAAKAFDRAIVAYNRLMNGEHDGPYLQTIGQAQDELRAAVTTLRAQEGE